MKVGSKAVMKFRDTKPLPSEITDERVNNATLPVKIETARRAIAACTDLPELLRYRDQAEGLAAAVRTMKQVGPEMIRNANCLMADAWRKGGELLGAYSGATKMIGNKFIASPRGKVRAQLGLSKNEAAGMLRIAGTTADKAYAAAQRTRHLTSAARLVPGQAPILPRGAVYSLSLAAVMGQANTGLVPAFSAARRIDLANFKLLTVDERKVVKAKITEIVELLDEMDRLCR